MSINVGRDVPLVPFVEIREGERFYRLTVEGDPDPQYVYERTSAKRADALMATRYPGPSYTAPAYSLAGLPTTMVVAPYEMVQPAHALRRASWGSDDTEVEVEAGGKPTYDQLAEVAWRWRKFAYYMNGRYSTDLWTALLFSNACEAHERAFGESVGSFLGDGDVPSV